jgi:hypothetical protein
MSAADIAALLGMTPDTFTNDFSALEQNVLAFYTDVPAVLLAA